MNKERVLEISLDEAIELFDINKWKFFEVDPDGVVKIEVPRGYSETYVVELPYLNPAQLNGLCEKLSVSGFIKQTIRNKGNF